MCDRPRLMDHRPRDDDDSSSSSSSSSSALTRATATAPTPAAPSPPVEHPAGPVGGGGGDDDDDHGDPLLWELRALLAHPPRRLYRPVKAALLADGHRRAAALLLAAALANHVRRVLAPWLGQFLWRHPVQAMRLAAGAPHWFVEEQLRSAAVIGPAALASWLLQTAALAAARALLRDRLLLARGGGGPAAAAAAAACLADAERVAYLALSLMRVEYAYAEACWAASWIYAAAHVLLRGTPAERRFTRLLLLVPGADGAGAGAGSPALAHWCGLALIADLLLWWSWRVVVLPARRHRGGFIGVALSGLPVAVGFVGAATAHVVRNANRYFIWLEMSEMLLTWAWMALGLALVVVWRCC